MDGARPHDQKRQAPPGAVTFFGRSTGAWERHPPPIFPKSAPCTLDPPKFASLARKLYHRRLMLRPSPSASARGFTLVELLVVVAMVGILATLAIVGYRKYVASAGTSEALAMIQQIRHAETERRSEMLRYLGCSGCGGTGCAPGAGSLTAYYPMATPNSKKYSWVQPSHSDYECWRLLNVRTDAGVRFGYAVVAGDAADAIQQPVGFKSIATIAQPNDPWYVIQAAGDRDEDGTFALLAASSWSNEVYIEDDTE